ASQLGAKVTLIEKDKIGGTCLHRGCIPTKSLLHDAKLLRSLKGSSVFQSLVPERFNPLQWMMERKRKVVEELAKGIAMLLESYRVTVKYARAELLGNGKLGLIDHDGKKETLEADAMILALGSSSKLLSNIPPDGERVLTSDEALEIKEVPREMVILGGGYIGVEFATLFHILGSRVTMVEILENILLGLEDELVRNLRRWMEREGIKILTQSSIEELKSREDGLALKIKTPKGFQEIYTEKLLLSVGRVPNLEVDFSKERIEFSPSGIRVNRRMETTAPNIYAIGDAIGGTLLAHVAMEEGVVAAENAMGIHHEMEDHPIPICVFTYPEMASIGLTEKEARTKSEIKIGRFPFRSNPSAVLSGETEGLIKVIADRTTDEILGVHIIGKEASVLISVATTMIGRRLKEFTQIFQAHPTLPEAFKEACLDVDGLAIHLPKPLRS
ncbi:MAG: dihydrolipoyl dehydrogenase, partial [Thermodesulfobacteriota bacterium]